jgi:predicted nuclease of restriction endonuclease-like (RecB) superfamily
MARRNASDPSLARSAEPLYQEIRTVLESARAGVYRAVNAAMVHAYWHVGRLIVSHEQKGRRRAGYGEEVIATLAERLTRDLGRGFEERNLWYMRKFYLAFPILNAPRSELPASSKSGTVPAPSPPTTLRPELSWTHYRLLLGVEDPAAREWYMREAADQHWSTRQLERQISVLYYERLLASRQKEPVREEAAARLATVEPEQFIRDPYVLDFLDLKDYPALRESTVEQAIIANLQAFLLELGKGFSFVARQKRMRFDDEDFYVDIVFYNYLL